MISFSNVFVKDWQLYVIRKVRINLLILIVKKYDNKEIME